MTAPADRLAEIRRLYFSATPATIQRDFERAIDLLKTMTSEEERERATVYMQGLAEMRRDAAGTTRQSPGNATRPRRRRQPPRRRS